MYVWSKDGELISEERLIFNKEKYGVYLPTKEQIDLYENTNDKEAARMIIILEGGREFEDDDIEYLNLL